MYLLMLFVCQFVSVVLVFSVALPLLSFYIEMDDVLLLCATVYTLFC